MPNKCKDWLIDVNYASGEMSVSTDGIHLDVVEDESKFYQLREEWESLVLISESPIYTNFSWISNWWKYFGKHPNREMFVIVIYNSDRLIAVAPFYIGYSRIGRIILQKRLSLMGQGVGKNESLGFRDTYGYSDFLDIVVDPEYRQVVARELAGFFTDKLYEIDRIELNHLSDASFIMSDLLPILDADKFDLTQEESDKCAFLGSPNSIDEYFGELSSNTRRRFRQSIKILENNDSVTVEDFSSPDKIDAGLNHLIDLHQTRWNKLGFPGLFFDDAFCKFIKSFLGEASRDGLIWFKLVKNENSFCAARLALKNKYSYYDYISGFDDESPIAKRRPAIGLMVKLIEDATMNGIKTVELLRGEEDYKSDFTSLQRTNWRVFLRVKSRRGFKRKAFDLLINSFTKIYFLFNKEFGLLKFHKEKSGILKMLNTYLHFRYKTLLLKIK